MDIKEKLLHIQVELKAPKSQYNTFGKYAYRNCEDILNAVKPLCDKYKCVVLVTDGLINLGDRFYIKASVTLSDIEAEGVVMATAYAREEENKKGMDASQITGAASSYARKYALNGLFAIDDTKDSDATNNLKEEQMPQPIRDEQYKEIENLCLQKGVTNARLEKSYNVNSIHHLTQEQYLNCVARLKGMKDKVISNA